MIVKWDETLPNAGPDAGVRRWDEWFAATVDEESLRAWRAAKETFIDPVVLGRWAAIIELNRLDRLFPTPSQGANAV